MSSYTLHANSQSPVWLQQLIAMVYTSGVPLMLYLWIILYTSRARSTYAKFINFYMFIKWCQGNIRDNMCTWPAFAHAFISAPIVIWSGSIGCISAFISANTSKARSTAPDWPHAVISALNTTRSGFTFYCI